MACPNREQLLAYPAGTERAQLIHVINARVEEINAQGKYVQLRGGRGFGYGDLLIATGSAPSGLPANLPGRNFDGVLSLHRLNDYLDLRRRLSEVEEVVVIGGGAHAIETVVETAGGVEYLVAGNGKIIDSQEEVGGYPVRPMTTRALQVPDGVEARRLWLDRMAAELEESKVTVPSPGSRR